VHVRTSYGYPGWVLEDDLVGDAPLDLARSYLGTRYEWGGMSSAGIDCSGLVHIAFRLSGRLVPRDAWQQDEAGMEVPEPQMGDLVTYGDPVDHIAFWAGPGRIVHSTGRDGGIGVVEEDEPQELRDRRHRFVRL
jgi:cell wall-associated NlpC family hydrolase